MEKQEAATTAVSLGQKFLSLMGLILPPYIAANIAHWSASELMGKRLSKRARIAVSLGSLSIACVTTWICRMYDITGTPQTIAIWFTSLTSDHILKFVYSEFGGIVKAWLKTSLNQILTKINKEQ